VVNGLKDILEDYKRSKSDNEENNKITLVFDKERNKFIEKKWENIKLGDIVKVRKDEYFPADIAMINTSAKEGECFIETKNLDGETNLKFKQSNYQIKSMFPNDNDFNLSNFQGILKTNKPNQHIYQFNALLRLEFNKENKSNSITNTNKDNKKDNQRKKNKEYNLNSKSINKDRLIEIVIENDNNNQNENDNENENIMRETNKNNFHQLNNKEEFDKKYNHIDNENILLDKSSFLLRGCSLKNTEFIIGVCVYTGHMTKIMMNSPKGKYKSSKLDNMMNNQIFIILIFQFILSTISSIYNYYWLKNNLNNLNYLYDEKNQNIINSSYPFFRIISGIGTWILIFTNLVPISLLVSLEMIKFIQGIYITRDPEIYDEVENIPAKVQTSTLNEELGQVKVKKNFIYFFIIFFIIFLIIFSYNFLIIFEFSLVYFY
jgi:magnesium-transporting ATPase (P-type)